MHSYHPTFATAKKIVHFPCVDLESEPPRPHSWLISWFVLKFFGFTMKMPFKRLWKPLKRTSSPSSSLLVSLSKDLLHSRLKNGFDWRMALRFFDFSIEESPAWETAARRQALPSCTVRWTEVTEFFIFNTKFIIVNEKFINFYKKFIILHEKFRHHTQIINPSGLFQKL